MRPFCLVMALLVCSSSMAREPRPEPSTTAKVVKAMDWTAVSLVSAALALRSASLVADERHRTGDQPLFAAAAVSIGVGTMTGLVSLVVKGLTKLSSPLSDVPGPFELPLSSSRVGRALQMTGVAVAMAGFIAFGVGDLMVDVMSSQASRSTPAGWLRIGGGFTMATGLLTAMVGGELREAPTVSVGPTTGGAVVGLSGRW